MNTLTKTTVTPIFVTQPDWDDAANFFSGCLLHRYMYPIDTCANGAQRRGWWYEEARIRAQRKARKFRTRDLSAPADPSLELPY